MKKKTSVIHGFNILEDSFANYFKFLGEDIKNIIKKNYPKPKYIDNYEFQVLTNYFFQLQTKDEILDIEGENINISLFIPILVKNSKLKKTFRCDIFAGVIPLKQENGTFFINGAERVFLSQLVFNPIIYKRRKKKQFDIIDKSFDIHFFKNQQSYIKITCNPTQTEFIVFNLLEKSIKLPISIIFSFFNITRKDFSYYNLTDEEKIRLNNIFSTNISNIKEFFINIKNLNSLFEITDEIRWALNTELNININQNILFLTKIDIINLVLLILNIFNNRKHLDTIDDLRNKRFINLDFFLKQRFETFLQTEFLIKIEKVISKIEKNTKFINNKKKVTTLSPIAIKKKRKKEIFSYKLMELFSTAEAVITAEDTNPLSLIAQQRKIFTLQKKDTASVPLPTRNLQENLLGRICAVETPEGESSGVITNLSLLTLTNSFGFLETPFVQLSKTKDSLIKKSYFRSSLEDSTTPIFFENFDKKQKIFYQKEIKKFLSYFQFFSVSCATIPFFEHSDAIRSLMGSNMQRQSVPLLFPEAPIIGTNIENLVAYSCSCIKSLSEGVVITSSNAQIQIKTINGNILCYNLPQLETTLNETVFLYTPLVGKGEKVTKGQIIANGFSIEDQELSLGNNLLIAYLSWEGFNFEDAIIISENLIVNDQLTSLHIKNITLEFNNDELLDNVNELILDDGNFVNFNSFGLINEGTFIKPNDILFIKKNLEDAESEYLFIRSNFYGFISDINITSELIIKNEKEELVSFTKNIIEIIILQNKKISVGDKISGRFGNKGIIAKIVAHQDMPYLLDGTPVDIIFNPLGIPSRMNIAQIYEGLLGLTGGILKKNMRILSFDEEFNPFASKILINQKIKEAALKLPTHILLNQPVFGKMLLYDGRSNELFDNPVLVTLSYFLKLFHLIEDKVAARTVGPNTQITNQPIRGKDIQGGQRFGEMEVWALEAYGAAYTLNEILTIKSDDIFLNSKLSEKIQNNEMFFLMNYSKAPLIMVNDLRALNIDLENYYINISQEKIQTKNIFNIMKNQEYLRQFYNTY